MNKNERDNLFKVNIIKEVENYYKTYDIVPTSICKEFKNKARKVKQLFGS